MSSTNPKQALDTRLLSAMKRLRLENINLQRQNRSLEDQCDQTIESLNQNHQRELQVLRILLAQRDEQIIALQQTILANQQELERLRKTPELIRAPMIAGRNRVLPPRCMHPALPAKQGITS